MLTALPSDASESARQLELARYQILDSPVEVRYDDLATLATVICGTPLAAISFFDGRRQWFKSFAGAAVEDAPMEQSFCTYTTVDPERPLVVVDATQDPRFAGAPHVAGVPHLRAYAGAAIVDEKQVPLGTICVFDVLPRDFSQVQLDALQALSRQVMCLLQLRGRLNELEHQRTELLALNAELDQFGYIVAHDLKSPIRQQAGFLRIIEEDFGETLSEELRTLLGQVGKLGQRAEQILDEVGSYLRMSSLVGESIQQLPLQEIFPLALALVEVPDAATIDLIDSPATTVLVPKAPLRHILANLIGNALKYSDKTHPYVRVEAATAAGHLIISVIDNGPGVEAVERKTIFQIFGRGRASGRAPGRGLGLAICYRLVMSLHGTITVEDAPGGGASFCVSIPI